MLAFAMSLVGAWAGISVFVGPLFGYRTDGSPAWTWDLQHALLYLAPGTAAVVASLMMLRMVGRAPEGRGGTHLAGTLAVAAGGWLVVGPSAWMALYPHHVVWTATSPWHRFLHEVGANLGPGALIIVFAAYALGLAGARPAGYRPSPPLAGSPA
jgi:hypothetical protein